MEKQYTDIKREFLNRIILDLQEGKGEVSDDFFIQIVDGLSDKKGYYYLLFPGGVDEVIVSLDEYMNNIVDSTCSANSDGVKSIRMKIKNAIEFKIIDFMNELASKKLIRYLEAIENKPMQLKLAAKFCDMIWRMAGDKSTDFNYYTKRALLISVYLRAQGFYLNDNSENHQATRKFIKNTLDNIINIASLKNKIKLPPIEEIPILRLFI